MIKKNLAYVSLLLISILSVSGVYSQPANDDICNAQVLVVDQPCTSPNGDNTGATEQPGEPEPACFSGGVNSVWFSFVAPPSGRVTITTNFPGAGTNTDTEIALYSLPGGNCNILSNLMEIDCHQDVDVNSQNYLSTLLAAPVTPGQIYYIQVSGWGGAEGSFCLEVNSYKIFVDKDATGVGDGSNWTNAFTELSTALTIVDLAALDNVEIWVAEGVYKPTLTNDRDASFTLKRGVKLMGGFDGTETSPAQRVSDSRGLFLTNESKLSGDIGVVGNSFDNSYSVVQFDPGQNNPITLDGFSIVEGNANVPAAGFDQNPSPQGGGGAIYMVGRPATDTIRGCIMADNNAFRGGVIYFKQNSPILDQCAFFVNEASDLGGAIYAFEASPSFSGCRFGGNRARFSGGGFFSRFSSSSFVNCIFQNNTGPSEGGAIYAGLSGDLSFSNCEFERNTAEKGGAINFFQVNSSLSNCKFSENTGSQSNPNGRGGAIHSRSSLLKISDTDFDRNKARKGGAIYIDNATGNDSISTSKFNSNFSDENGGGMFVEKSLSIVDSCIFQGNIAITDGGGFYGDISDSKISCSVFEGNESNFGAGLYLFDGNPQVVSSQFIRNKVSNSGGGILYRNSSPLIDSCRFRGNRAVGQGGGMLGLTGSSVISNSIFENDSAGLGGGLSVEGGTSILQSIQFINNEAFQGGGLVFNNTSSPIRDCQFIGNEADSLGGGFIGRFSSSALTNCVFQENTCRAEGGGVFGFFSATNRDTSLQFVNCTFERNTARNGGGIGYFTGNPSLDNCTFTGNRATQFGGGINSEASSFLLRATLFDANEAFRGGGIYFDASGSRLDSCNFEGNNADQGGGAILNKGSSPEFYDCSFLNNESTLWGGAISNSGNSSPLIRNCEFQFNTAPSGGAIHNERFCNPLIKRTKFISNSAGSSGGGAILNTPESLPIIDSCEFIGNQTVHNLQIESGGGAIYNWESNAIISHSFFRDNEARLIGGAISNRNANPEITFSIFEENTAFTGGAIYNRESSKPYISASSFIENFTQQGGAITITASSATILNSTFARNRAVVKGGAMAIFELDAEGDATRIYGSTFYENSAGANGGGAIVLVRAPLELKNSIVANNTFLNGLSSNILNEVGQGTVQITSLGYNFIGDSTNSLLSFLDSDILGSNVNPLDPMLDTLGFYGGPTLVHPPLAGSTVRGVGEPIESTDLLTDQRGFSRKRGSREGNIDIGAFEAQSSFISPIARALCVEEPEFLPLQAILIQDSTGGAFENGENLSLEYAAPDGLEFQVGQGTVNCLGSGLSDCNINVSSDLITITYTRSYDTLLNSIEIRDIFIKAESGTDPTFAELIRTGGNALQYDNEVGDAVNIASVSILPTVKLADLPYDDSFESNQSFWIPSGDSSIWEVGSPQGEIIDRAASGQNVWMTDLDGSYSTLDTSWVASSCFDFRGLSNPLLSVSIWSDTESGFDGTVFQQSLDGGDSWQTVGTNERGINWYNSATISANPGKQTTQEEYGWTGRDTAWRRAFVKLDQVDDQDAVRFRFAFASIGQIDETQSNNGFAFDDFFIGESDTRVLMEHFTDDSPVRNVANEEVQGLVSSFSPNVIPIQYHITAGDEFYERNKAGPRVRGLYYGVSEAGNAVVNGNEFLGLSRELDAGVLERSLLKTSSISVGLDTLEDEAIKILPSRDIPEEAVLYVAVVENTEEQEAVFRAFLPNAGGVLLNDPQAGVLQSFNISWDETTSASTSILDNYDSLEVVVFVQNRETKEVYQSISSPIWSGLLERNALREGLFNDPEAKLSFYPNPVHEYIFLDFGKINQERLQLSISDLQGKSVFQQLIKPGLSLYELNLAQLSRGMYFLHLTKEGESVRKEKIILR